uniref:Polycystin-2 n=1 Tax=Lygus hesperus TaxID=30085 RepID=A0A0A9Z3C0_LYGHE
MDLNQISKDSQGCDWNEPFEIAIEDVNWGYDGNLVQQAAGGSRRRLNLGGVSRIVLEPEQPDRPQPRKMKKEKGPGDDPSSAANVAGKEMVFSLTSSTDRVSVSASIRQAFSSRHSSASKSKKSSRGWDPQQKYKRKSSSRRRSTVTVQDRLKAMKNLPQKVRDTFFWLDKYEYEGVTEIILELRRFSIHVIYLTIIWSIFATFDFSDKYAGAVLSDSITMSKYNSSFGRPGTFVDLRSIGDVLSFIKEVLLQILFDPSDAGRWGTPQLLTSMVLVGAPQIRQVRVKNTTCYYHPIIQGLYRSCYDYYSKNNEDTESFGMNYSAWRYTSVPDGYDWEGVLSTYGGGGYSMNFSDINSTRFWLSELEENSWIRPGTRAVIVTFTTATANVYCVAKLAFELPPVGGVITSSSFHTAKFNRFLDGGSFFILSCEFCLIIFTVYYTVDLWKDLSRKEAEFSFWTVVNLIIICLSYAVIIIEVTQTLSVTERFQNVVSVIHTTEHASLDRSLRYQFALECCGSVLLGLALVKLFKFSSLTKPTSLICSAFDKVKYELLAVVITTAVMTMGFAVLGMSIFGDGIVGMRTLWEAFFSLVFLSSSNFSYYRDCFRISKLWTYIFFPGYIAFIFLFVLNTCGALVVFGFLTAAEEAGSDQKHLYLGDVIKEAGILILPHFGFQRLAYKLRASLLYEMNVKEYDAFVRILLRYEWKWREIQLFMRSHSLERGDKLSFEQLIDAYDDFWVRQQLAVEVSGHHKLKDRIKTITETIERIEATCQDVKTKAELVADRKLLKKSR